VADKYVVPALPDLAAQALDKVCESAFSIPEFLDAVRPAEAVTVSKDGPLWASVKPKIRKNITILLQCEEFRNLFLEPEFVSLNLEMLGLLDPNCGGDLVVRGETHCKSLVNMAGANDDARSLNDQWDQAGGYTFHGTGRRLG